MTRHVLRIESRRNARFKEWLSYTSNPEHSGCSWLPVEGWKQVTDVAARRPIELLLFDDEQGVGLQQLLSRSREAAQLPKRLIQILSQVEVSQGLLAFFQKPVWRWKQLTSCILYLYKLQDPGNLGTLFRTARATGIASIVTSPGTVSCFNSKVVRASATAIFSTPFLEGRTVGELRKRGYHLWATAPGKGSSLFEAQWNSPLAILLGSEGSGLREPMVRRAAHRLHIPMHPEAESLNAAVAGSLILYEVSRWMNKHG